MLQARNVLSLSYAHYTCSRRFCPAEIKRNKQSHFCMVFSISTIAGMFTFKYIAFTGYRFISGLFSFDARFDVECLALLLGLF